MNARIRAAERFAARNVTACGNCKLPIPEGCDGRQYAFTWPGGGGNSHGIACRGRWGSDLDQVGLKLRITKGHGESYEVAVELLAVPPA